MGYKTIPLVPVEERKSKIHMSQPRIKRCALAAVVFASIFIFLKTNVDCLGLQKKPASVVESFEQCSIDTFLGTGLKFLDSASELPQEEFIERRARLAIALAQDEIDAFIVEPGYTLKYYANISQPEWEVWEPEERPMLMIVQPFLNQSTGQISPKVTFLVPQFEVSRVQLLGMPFDEELNFVAWEEHWNPYATLRKSWNYYSSHPDTSAGAQSNSDPKIMVDDEMRDFIQRGLGQNGFEVIGLGGAVERVKQTKSPNEIEIIRAVNTGTVEAVRAMRGCMYPGLTENEVMNSLDDTLRAGGMEPFFDIVLFDSNAALPHGGTNGSKVLDAETFVLIDVGAHLYGYSSDICRTFFPPFYPKPRNKAEIQALPPIIQKKLEVWDIVLEAQTQSMHVLRAGNSAASVDIAARKVITDAGYGSAFTHRVGHGIGIKAHESPYLNKGNINVTLSAGMTFTSEPGIYLDYEFGVRHEDILLVNEGGEPEVLTGDRATGPWNP